MNATPYQQRITAARAALDLAHSAADMAGEALCEALQDCAGAHETGDCGPGCAACRAERALSDAAGVERAAVLALQDAIASKLMAMRPARRTERVGLWAASTSEMPQAPRSAAIRNAWGRHPVTEAARNLHGVLDGLRMGRSYCTCGIARVPRGDPQLAVECETCPERAEQEARLRLRQAIRAEREALGQSAPLLVMRAVRGAA